MKILCVDDSAAIRRIIRNSIDVLGFETVEAADGLQGWETLEKMGSDIKLVLLDWNMPNLDGYSLLVKIKQDPRFVDIPVTMVTTESERAKVVQAIKAGARNYLVKPFSAEDLKTKIMESIGMEF